MRQLQVRNRSDCPQLAPRKLRPQLDGKPMSTTERKLDFRDKRRETEQIKSAHEKRRPGAQPSPFFALRRKPRISQVKTPKSNQSNDARSTTQPSPIDLSRNRCVGKSNRLRNTFISAAKPNRSHRTIIMQLGPTQHTAQPTPHSSPTAHTAPPATRPARRHRPHAPKPHAHQATDEYPGPSSAHSRASPSRARGTHRRALAPSPRPRRPAAPRTPARAHASR